MHKYLGILWVATLLAFSGCASLSKEQCQQGDWSGIGYRDGSAGRSAARLQAHSEACAKFKITPDANAYESGRKRGLEQVYCLPRNGYRLGLSGGGNRSVCPSHMSADFANAMNYGLDIYRLRQKANAQKTEIANTDTELNQLHARIDELTQNLRNYRSLREQLLEHLQMERDTEMGKVGDMKQTLIDDLRLSHREERMINRLVSLALSKGRMQNRIWWMNRTQNSHRFRRRMHQIDRDMDRVRNNLGVRDMPPKAQARISRMEKWAMYTGTLDGQKEILRRVASSAGEYDAVRQVVEFHYNRAPGYIKDGARPLLQVRPGLDRRDIHEELRHAREDKRRLHDRKRNAEDRLNDLASQIEQMQNNSPYR